jgi:hypothetical protein
MPGNQTGRKGEGKLSLFVDDPTCKKPQGIYKNITQTIK